MKLRLLLAALALLVLSMVAVTATDAANPSMSHVTSDRNTDAGSCNLATLNRTGFWGGDQVRMTIKRIEPGPVEWATACYATECETSPDCWWSGSDALIVGPTTNNGPCITWELAGVRFGFYDPVFPDLPIGMLNPGYRVPLVLCGYDDRIVIVLSPCYDVELDAMVSVSDIFKVVADFGQSGEELLTDLNEDTVVSTGDLNRVVSQFGHDCTGFDPKGYDP